MSGAGWVVMVGPGELLDHWNGGGWAIVPGEVAVSFLHP